LRLAQGRIPDLYSLRRFKNLLMPFRKEILDAFESISLEEVERGMATGEQTPIIEFVNPPRTDLPELSLSSKGEAVTFGQSGEETACQTRSVPSKAIAAGKKPGFSSGGVWEPSILHDRDFAYIQGTFDTVNPLFLGLFDAWGIHPLKEDQLSHGECERLLRIVKNTQPSVYLLLIEGFMELYESIRFLPGPLTWRKYVKNLLTHKEAVLGILNRAMLDEVRGGAGNRCGQPDMPPGYQASASQIANLAAPYTEGMAMIDEPDKMVCEAAIVSPARMGERRSPSPPCAESFTPESGYSPSRGAW
jgi:hypothetical protein